MTSKPYKNDYILSWSDFHRKTKLLAELVMNMRKWKGIIAVTRGGLFPSGIIARELSIFHIDTICVNSYDGQNRGELNLIKDVQGEGEDFLIVDDLVDSGKTVKFIRERMPKGYFVTVFAKPNGRPYIDGYIEDIPQDTWVRFPWDMEMSFSTPLVTSKPEF